MPPDAANGDLIYTMDFKIITESGVDNSVALIKNACEEKSAFVYETCRFSGGGYAIIDFGEEIGGSVSVVFGKNSGDATIRIRLGESVYEACAEQGEKNAGNDHSLRDNFYRVITLGEITSSESGFRFVRIDNVSSQPVEISRIYVKKYDNGLKRKGYFACDDARLNEIYKAAERTISLCVRKNEIWDGVKRDRAMWIGDFYPELLAAFYVYGVIPQFERVLTECAPNDVCWVNKIPSYSAWWVICLEKYYELSGKKAFVKKLLGKVDFVVNAFSSVICENGEADYTKCKLDYYPCNEFFFDWPTNLTPDSENGWRYVVAIALKKAIKLYSLFKADCSTAQAVLERLKRYKYKDSKFKQVTAFGVISGFTDKEKGLKLLGNDEHGMTCFMSFAIAKALGFCGAGDVALNVLKKYYGAMLDFGATTFWEDFDISCLKDNPDSLTELPRKDKKNVHADYGKICYKGLRGSLCHGWSTGFVDFFYTYVLGVVPTSAGYKTIKIEPHLCGLSFAEGAFPTKYGLIKIKHSLENGSVKTELELPKGVSLG